MKIHEKYRKIGKVVCGRLLVKIPLKYFAPEDNKYRDSVFGTAVPEWLCETRISREMIAEEWGVSVNYGRRRRQGQESRQERNVAALFALVLTETAMSGGRLHNRCRSGG